MERQHSDTSIASVSPRHGGAPRPAAALPAAAMRSDTAPQVLEMLRAAGPAPSADAFATSRGLPAAACDAQVIETLRASVSAAAAEAARAAVEGSFAELRTALLQAISHIAGAPASDRERRSLASQQGGACAPPPHRQRSAPDCPPAAPDEQRRSQPSNPCARPHLDRNRWRSAPPVEPPGIPEEVPARAAPRPPAQEERRSVSRQVSPPLVLVPPAARPRVDRRQWRSAPTTSLPREEPGIPEDVPAAAVEAPRSEERDISWASMTPPPSERASSTSSISSAFGATTYSMGRPTVQSLQADIAMSILDNSMYGATMRGATTPSRHSRREARQRGFDAAGVPDPAAGTRPHDAPDAMRLPHEVDDFESESHGWTSVADALSWCSSAARTASRTSHASSRRGPGSRILQQYVDERAQEAMRNPSIYTSDESRASRVLPASPVPAWLRIVGLLRWDAAEELSGLAAAYQWLARSLVVLAAAAVLLPLARSAMAPDCGPIVGCDAEAPWGAGGIVSRLPFALGALFALFSLGLRTYERRMEQTLRLVHVVGADRGYAEREVYQRRFDAAFFVLVWLGTVAAAAFSGEGVVITAVQAGSVAISSAATLSLCQCVVCVSRSLVLMVDDFTIDLIEGTPLDKVAHAWNVTQVVLRKASMDIERCLLALIATIVVMGPLLIADAALLGARVLHLIPGLVLSCGVVYALLVAATVAQKCARVPAFVNTIAFGPGTEHTRQRAVDYVASSAAGLYILDTRLTALFVARLMCAWCIVGAGLRLVAADP